MAIHTSELLPTPTYTQKQLRELCSSSQSFIRPEAIVIDHTTSAPHPQLLDLLICPREGKIASLNGNSIIGLDFVHERSERLFHLSYNANCLVQGHGLIVTGGQNSQLSVRSWSDERRADWSTANYSVGGSINNSIHICPLPGSSRTVTRPGPTESQDPIARLLVSNNDASIIVYDVHQPTSSSSTMSDEMDLDEDRARDRRELQDRPILRKQRAISMSTAINHSSVSPDGRFMVAVGDTNDAFFFACPQRPRDPYVLVHVTKASSDGGFSTDWSRDSQTCAVASQDGVVTIFDIRSLKQSTSQGSAKTVARFNTIASDPHYAGRTGSRDTAARVVKYSPGSGNELLAFTEQRSCAQVVDARSYDSFSAQFLHLPKCERSARRETTRLPPIGSPAGRSLLNALAQSGDRSSALTYAAHMFNSGTASYSDIFPPVENLFGEEALGFASPDWMPPSHSPLQPDHARFLVSDPPRPAALPSLSAFLNSAADTRVRARREMSPTLPELGEDGRLRFGSLGDASSAASNRPTEVHLPYCGLEDAAKMSPSGVELRGLAWSPGGDKLYMAGENSCVEFNVDVNARNSWPCRSIV